MDGPLAGCPKSRTMDHVFQSKEPFSFGICGYCVSPPGGVKGIITLAPFHGRTPSPMPMPRTSASTRSVPASGAPGWTETLIS